MTGYRRIDGSLTLTKQSSSGSEKTLKILVYNVPAEITWYPKRFL